MEVILSQDFPALGYVGDRVRVKPGYGRNFLIPRSIAVEASSLNERMLKHRLTAINAKRVKLRAQAQEFCDKLQALVLEFTIKVGAGGRSFGAISIRDIEAQLKEKGFELDRRQVKLLEPIKRAGEYKVQVKLHSEVSATIPVIVRSDAPAARKAKEQSDAGSAEGTEADGTEQKPARKARGKKAKAEAAGSEESAAPAGESDKV